MLVLSRRLQESFYLGDGIKVTVLQARGGRVKLGITAPAEVRVMREELVPVEERKNNARILPG